MIDTVSEALQDSAGPRLPVGREALARLPDQARQEGSWVRFGLHPGKPSGSSDFQGGACVDHHLVGGLHVDAADL